MKLTLIALFTFASIHTFADVCQIKPSSTNHPVNRWELKKGDQILSSYTFHDVDLSKGIQDREHLILENACHREAILEKCEVKIVTIDSRVNVQVLVGDKVAESFGNLPYFDQYSLNKARDLIHTLKTNLICVE